jgi:hypothetical protein
VALFGALHRKQVQADPAPVVAAPVLQGVPALVDELDQLVALTSERIRERREPLAAWQVDRVVEALAEEHDPIASEALARAARRAVDADAPLTAALLRGLVRDGSDTALEALLDDALGRTEDLAARASAALAEVAAEQVVPRVVARLSTPEPDVRARAVTLVGRLGGAGAVDALVPLLTDDAATVRDRAAEALGDLGDPRALLPLLVAEETERRGARAGHSAMTFDGRLSPYLLAVARIVTGDRAVGWSLLRERPYDGEDHLAALVEPARSTCATDLTAATEGIPVRRQDAWRVEELEALLARGAALRQDVARPELHYFDAAGLVRDRERCRRLGLEVGEEAGESHDTVYGEKVDWVVTVGCADGILRLVGDQEDVLRVERSS